MAAGTITLWNEHIINLMAILGMDSLPSVDVEFWAESCFMVIQKPQSHEKRNALCWTTLVYKLPG